MTLGFGFIYSVLQSAVQTLDAAQYAKYATYHTDFLDFTSRTTLWGPRWWHNQSQKNQVVQQAQPTLLSTANNAKAK
jgi:hypothetical protein